MKQFGSAELVSDYGDFGRPQALREALQSPPGGPRLFLSPDGRYLLVWLGPQRRLLSFLHLPASSSTSPPPQPGDYLEHSWPAQSPPLVGLLFPQSPGQAWTMALVWENGRAEVWSPPRGPADRSWSLLKSAELCQGPRARVVSACCCHGDELLWCEERTTANLLTYCLCRRSLRASGRRVSPGAMTIVLHHSPPYDVLAAAGRAFMVPRAAGRHPLLIYAPAENSVTLAGLAAGVLHSKALGEADADYKKLILECPGAAAADVEIRYAASSGGPGSLLVATAAGRIHLLHGDGTARHVYDLGESLGADAQIRMAVSGGTLVCTVDSCLYLIDIRSGRLAAKQALGTVEVLLIDVSEGGDVRLMTNVGVYKAGGGSGVTPPPPPPPPAESALLDMVYEEACKYYQRRSLSSAKLTAQSLKENGMFQAPIALAAILCRKSEAAKYAELLGNIDHELQSFLSLELLKSRAAAAPQPDVARCCDELVDLELTRLLQADPDRDGLAYINSLFATFPTSAWASVRNNFQFQQNGDGKLVVRATADLWKKVLSPLPPSASQNGVHPLFEVICQSLCANKPKWLPGFVQHAQECAGLYRNFTSKERGEGAPLYKRALNVLNKRKDNTNVELEVEILLCSGRPQAVIQAIHTLIRLQRWPRVMEETQRYSQLNPLIKKDIFITLLVEFVQHRQLDSYVPQLCDICPEDLTATDILRIVLQSAPKTPPAAVQPPPFSTDSGKHLTMGLLKPLLNKALQRQFRRGESFPNPTFPPAAPQRTNKTAANGEDLSPPDIYATKAL